jgi:hypothetical protein
VTAGPAALAGIVLSRGGMSTQPMASSSQMARSAARGLLALVVFAGCPGQLEFPRPLLDAGFGPRPGAAPDAGTVPSLPDASVTAPPRPDASLPPPPPPRDASLPPPPAPDAGGPPAYCTSTDQVVARVLRPRCGMCHDASAALFVGLDLVAAGVRDRLRQASTICVGRAFVVTAPNVGGYFFDKLGATPPCGQRMPPVGAALDAGEIECLKAWARANP